MSDEAKERVIRGDWPKTGAVETVAEFIDQNSVTCDCCQHVLIDVTAARTGEKQHAVAGDPEGDGVGCAHSWHQTVRELEEEEGPAARAGIAACMRLNAKLMAERDVALERRDIAQALADVREIEADRLRAELAAAIEALRAMRKYLEVEDGE